MLSLLRTRRFAPLFITQLLGALNDNVFKSALVIVITLGAAGVTRSPEQINTLVNLSTAMLVLPFFLFSAIAGRLADTMDKARLVRTLKRTELGVMALAALGFALGNVPLLFVTLFLMGAQSAFFGPVKYSLLPQHLHEEELVAGNALVELGTFLAILGGTVLGGVLGGVITSHPALGLPLLTLSLLGVAVTGTLSARFVPSAPPAADAPAPGLRGYLTANRETWRAGTRDADVRDAIVGASWFWLLGALLLGQFPALATEVLGGGADMITGLLGLFSLGVGVGSLGAERASHGAFSRVLEPVGACLMALFGLVLAALALGPAPSFFMVALAVVGLGVAGGLFIVPLYATMQRRAEPAERSRVIAANNIANALFMVIAAALAAGLRAAGLSLGGLLLVAFAAHALVTLALVFRARRDFFRLAVRPIVRLMYRLDVDLRLDPGQDADRVRAELLEHGEDGAAIVVANHVSYMDAVILGALAPRPMRFVMDHRIFKSPILGPFFRFARAIPIASAKEDPALKERAFGQIRAALEAGELVCIFPEGRLTRDGDPCGFRPGIERILAEHPAPVIPVGITGLWGSFFSYADGTAPCVGSPKRFRAPVQLRVGAPVPVSAEPTAASLEARVLSLYEQGR